MNPLESVKIHPVNQLPPPIRAGHWIGLDTEYFRIPTGKLHRPHLGSFASLQIARGDEVWVITDPKKVAAALKRIDRAVWVFHTASFDLPRLRRFCDIPPRPIWDVLLIERLMYTGYYDTFSLKALARRWLQVHLKKETREQFSHAETLTPEMIEYGAYDAWATLQIGHLQDAEIRDEDRWLWENVDQPAMWATFDFQGIRLDVKHWNKLAQRYQTRAQEIRKALGFNPGSPQQTLDALRKVGVELADTGRGTLEEAWNQLKKSRNKKAANLLSRIMEYRDSATAYARYGPNFVTKHVESDGKFYPRWDVSRARSGRMASSEPNGQNLPNDDEHRGCIIASPGNQLIVGDVAQQEPRLTARISGDAHFAEIFRNHEDVYLGVATRVTRSRKQLTKDSPERVLFKKVVLGLSYGLTAYGLAPKIDKTQEEAEKVIRDFFNTFGGVRAWIQHERRSPNRPAETLLGRRRFHNPYHRSWLNVALNHPIQGSAGDALKLAIIQLHRQWKPEWGKFGVIAAVHDELVLDVPRRYARPIAKLVERALVETLETMLETIPAEAEVVIGRTWAIKHGHDPIYTEDDDEPEN